MKDSTDDTLGGIGRAARLKLGTRAEKNGTLTGTLIVQFNHRFSMFVRIPNQPASPKRADFLVATLQSTGKLATVRSTYSSTPLFYADAQMILSLTNLSTLLYTRSGLLATTLDSLAIDTVSKVDIPVPAVNCAYLSTDTDDWPSTKAASSG